MTFSEFQEFRAFLRALTAKTRAGWHAQQKRIGIDVRIEPVACAETGRPLQAGLIMHIGPNVDLDEAKAIITDRLSQGSEAKP